jgi:hypothetical protein
MSSGGFLPMVLRTSLGHLCVSHSPRST